MRMNSYLVFLAGSGLFIGLRSFWRGWRDLRLHRTMGGTATSRIRSIAMGHVEVYGVARPVRPLADPISGHACVYFSIAAEQQVGERGKPVWQALFREDSGGAPFWVEDETGRAFVAPAGARFALMTAGAVTADAAHPEIRAFVERKIAGTPAAAWPERIRVSRAVILPGEKVYVMGYAEAVGGGPTPAYGTEAEALPAGTIVLRAPRDGSMVISDRTETMLASEVSRSAHLKIFGGPVLALACGAYLALRLVRWAGEEPESEFERARRGTEAADATALASLPAPAAPAVGARIETGGAERRDWPPPAPTPTEEAERAAPTSVPITIEGWSPPAMPTVYWAPTFDSGGFALPPAPGGTPPP